MRASASAISTSNPVHPDELPDLVQRFFADYLVSQRNLSARTRQRLSRHLSTLPVFSRAKHHHRWPDQLTLDTVSPATVLAFLSYLETTRGNSPRTRNLRLAAIRPLCGLCWGNAPAPTSSALAIRYSRSHKRNPPNRSSDS